MIPGSGGEPPSEVLAYVNQLMAGITGHLEIQSGDVLGLIDSVQLDRHFTKLLGDRPGWFDQLSAGLGHFGASAKATHPLDILPAARVTAWLGQLKVVHKQAQYGARKRDLQHLLNAFVIRRAVASLTDQEKALLRGYAAMYADGGLSLMQWHAFYGLMTWAEGASDVDFPEGGRGNKNGAEAKDFLKKLTATALPVHKNVIANGTAMLANYQAKSATLARLISDALNVGSRWFELADVASSRVYSTNPTPSSLLVGYAGESMTPLYFSGNESLITFGGPNAGKTQGQVIPNLLRYPGSAFVLDVKGELWDQTADHRRRHFGPVLRFSPTADDGETARYNPFDAIGRDPASAAVDAQVLAYEIVPENPNLKDPYWETKGRDLIWAFATLVALKAPPEKRNLAEVSRYLGIQVNFDSDTGAYKRSETKAVVSELRELAAAAGLQDLGTVATSIEGGITSTRLESVFDNARSHLSSITRSSAAVAALSASDWSPLDLRNQRGTTVYLSLRPGELRAFAPLVRIVFQQHISALAKDFTRRENEPPVTFFMDELPQLGLMPGLSDIIDIGRGAGLRLWMFAQYLGQIREIYQTRADGLVNACAVRCFMQPDNDAAKFIEPQLGSTINILSGQSKPLAETHDLMGRAFADTIVTLARGEHPARLAKVFACHEQLEHVA